MGSGLSDENFIQMLMGHYKVEELTLSIPTENSNSMKSSDQEVFPGFDLKGHQKVYMKHDDFA